MMVYRQWQNRLAAVGRDFSFQFFNLDFEFECLSDVDGFHLTSPPEKWPRVILD
jgi:hypothetical protein